MNTNTPIYRKERLESIGWITPEMFLKQAFWIEHEDDVSRLSGKTLLDVGAGFSDLLDYISEHADPNRMIAVDPIYGGQEPEATIFTLNSIQEFINVILSDPGCANDGFLMNMRANAERQKQTILDYHNQNVAIERYKNIPDDISADYAFAINVLYAAKDPRSILEKMDQELDPNGQIIIVDYVWRGNNINGKIEGTGISMNTFEQYFVAKLRKWDVHCIDWSKK